MQLTLKNEMTTEGIMNPDRTGQIAHEKQLAIGGVAEGGRPSIRRVDREAFLTSREFQEVDALPGPNRDRDHLAVGRNRHRSPMGWQTQRSTLPTAGYIPEEKRTTSVVLRL